MMPTILDACRLLWLASVTALIVWLPAAASARSLRPPLIVVLQQFIVSTMVMVGAVSILSAAHLLNPFTLAVACGCWPAGRWMVRHRRSMGADAHVLVRGLALNVARHVEGADSRRLALVPARTMRSVATRERRIAPSAAVMALALLLATSPAIALAMANTRLASSGEYGLLLRAQQMFAGEGGWRLPDAAAAVTAALSVTSAITPVHVLRFLAPIACLMALLAFVTGVRLTTASRMPAVIGALTAAAMMGGTVPSVAASLAATFLLLSITFADVAFPARGGLRLAAAAGVLAALADPISLIALSGAAALRCIAPSGVMLGAGAAWLAASWAASASAPLAWALVAAGITNLVVCRYELRRPPVRMAFATAVAGLALAVNVPRTVAAHFVEYDAAARKTLEIATQFPSYRWMVVAPVEEWPLSYGRGWHMNLHEFVDEIGPRAVDDTYRLPFKVDDVFVFVETRPFAGSMPEPQDVPFSTLIDPVYRHYRSPAGRASLQFAAHALCERLRQQDPDATVYFDDGRLKIYRFTLR